MNILTTYFTASRLFTFVRKGMMYVEFNSVTLFTVLDSLYSCPRWAMQSVVPV